MMSGERRRDDHNGPDKRLSLSSGTPITERGPMSFCIVTGKRITWVKDIVQIQEKQNATN